MFYIWLNIASTQNHYWNQLAQNWTTNHKDATLFETRQEAEAEAAYAQATYNLGEAIVKEKAAEPAAA